MAGATKQISIRMKPEGGAEVVAEARKVEDALVGGANRSKTATDAAVAAADRQVQKLREVGAAAATASRSTAVQANIDRMTGVSSGGNASAQVAARSLYAADEKAAQLAAAIRAEIDPLAAATDRYNAELVQMTALQARGHLTAQEFARGQELAKNRLDATTAALGRNTNGLTRNQAASRLNLTRQAADVAVTAGMGMNPAMIALQQGPQILEAFAMSGIKARGAMLLLGGAVTAVAGGVAVLGAAYLAGEANALKLERVTTGLGRASGLTARQLEELAISAADQSDISVAAARDQAVAYAATGRIGGEVIGDLIALGKDYASVMGLEAEEATQALAKAMLSPDVAARDLTRSIGLMDQKTLDHIDTLVKAGQQYEAQALLVDALSDRMKSHGEQISQIDSFWGNATRSLSNYWDQLDRAMFRTREEQVKHLDWRISVNENPAARRSLTRQRDDLQAEIIFDQNRAFYGGLSDRENRDAQLAEDRKPRARTRRGNGEAERAERERLARQRREEDREYYLDTEVARSAQDYAALTRLEDTNAVRQRERQLIDDGLDAEKARTQALEEQQVLIDAREQVFARERESLATSVELEASRIDGMDRFVATKEREAELAARIVAYSQADYDLATAIAAATSDQLILDEARATAMERNAAAREREHQLDLAIARGDHWRSSRLERESWIARRAREIEANSATPMNRGEGDAQAAREYGELLDAEMTGTRVDFAKGLVDDLRNSSIEDVLADQFLGASDRLIEHLIEQLFATDWAAAFQGQGGMPEGGGWLAALTEGLFGGTPGRNASGTDYWRGGLSWVGEDGPELMHLPRGSQVIDHQRSMRLALGGGSNGETVVHQHYYLDGAVMADDLWKRIDQGDRQAARVGARQGASTAVSIVQATAAETQRAERMMRG